MVGEKVEEEEGGQEEEKGREDFLGSWRKG